MPVSEPPARTVAENAPARTPASGRLYLLVLIGMAVGGVLGALHPDRWMMRFSVAADDNPQPMQATTIWRQPEGSNVPEGLICPAQTHKTAACATCGLCWSPGATGKRIVFIGHGMSHGSRKDAA